MSQATAQPNCTTQSTNTSNFSGTPIEGGTYIWFNAHFTASGISKTQPTTIYFQNSSIQFTAVNSYNLNVPNAEITFDPSVACVSTTFDASSSTWITSP